MNWSLSDYANLVTVVTLPLTIVLWLFTREHAAKFWKSYRTPLFVLVAVLTVWGAWRFGWLNWLGKQYTVRLWFLLLLGLLIFVLLVALVRKYLKHIPEGDGPLDWIDYVRDEIFGVDWAWQYRGRTLNKVVGAFCPHKQCQCRLSEEHSRKQPSGYYHDLPPVALFCPRCGFREDFDCDIETLKRRVFTEVERKVRTGEFELVLRGQIQENSPKAS